MGNKLPKRAKKRGRGGKQKVEGGKKSEGGEWHNRFNAILLSTYPLFPTFISSLQERGKWKEGIKRVENKLNLPAN